MNCGKCHNPLTFVPTGAQWWCGYCRYYLQAPPPPGYAENARKAQKLVNLSHIFGWGGLGMMFIGSGVAGALFGAAAAGGAAVLGVVSAIAGAVLGQVGRAMQGRVI